mmetsp:Transcript_14814/g.44644  ORF Transcript_14814/g.44644 Transcript_14814/m.44644 type:complete len:204 (-) Transcript_14814:1674-2285(-)
MPTEAARQACAWRLCGPEAATPQGHEANLELLWNVGLRRTYSCSAWAHKALHTLNSRFLVFCTLWDVHDTAAILLLAAASSYWPSTFGPNVEEHVRLRAENPTLVYGLNRCVRDVVPVGLHRSLGLDWGRNTSSNARVCLDRRRRFRRFPVGVLLFVLIALGDRCVEGTLILFRLRGEIRCAEARQVHERRVVATGRAAAVLD